MDLFDYRIWLTVFLHVGRKIGEGFARHQFEEIRSSLDAKVAGVVEVPSLCVHQNATERLLCELTSAGKRRRRAFWKYAELFYSFIAWTLD